MFNRLLVSVLRRYTGTAPVSVQIARSMLDKPAEWSVERCQIDHPAIGSVLFPITPLLVKIKVGIWKPNYLERKVLAAAVAWRTKVYPKQVVAHAFRMASAC